MRILILGAGGVGGYFGGRLIEGGADVTFLVRPAKARELADKGLRIASPHGNAQLQVNCVTRETVKPAYDLVILAPKAYDLEDAVASVADAAGTDAYILPLLNGLAHLDVLERHFGRARVLGGVAHIAAMLDPDGTVKQLSDMHSLTVGGRSPGTQDVAGKFIALCKAAKFDAFLAEHIENVLWEKWTFLATLAGITTLMQGSIGQIMEARDGESLVRQLYAECLAVADAGGMPVAESARQKSLAMLTQRDSAFTASMLRDLQAGRRTEHDHILGDMLARAAQAGLASPLLKAAYAHMQVCSTASHQD